MAETVTHPGLEAHETPRRAGRSRATRSASSSRSRDFPRRSRSSIGSRRKAQAADHHPDILINYKRVTLTYSTHSEGGLTAKDFAGAAMADKLA